VASSVLTRYRVMAYTTAVLLIVLVFVGLPLQAAGHKQVAVYVGTLHGFLYLIYLVVAFELTRRMHIPIIQTVLVLLAGTIPFGAIYAERRLTRVYETQQRRAARAAAAAEAENLDEAAKAGAEAATVAGPRSDLVHGEAPPDG
jgi:integral membrane protein